MEINSAKDNAKSFFFTKQSISKKQQILTNPNLQNSSLIKLSDSNSQSISILNKQNKISSPQIIQIKKDKNKNQNYYFKYLEDKKIENDINDIEKNLNIRITTSNNNIEKEVDMFFKRQNNINEDKDIVSNNLQSDENVNQIINLNIDNNNNNISNSYNRDNQSDNNVSLSIKGSSKNSNFEKESSFIENISIDKNNNNIFDGTKTKEEQITDSSMNKNITTEGLNKDTHIKEKISLIKNESNPNDNNNNINDEKNVKIKNSFIIKLCCFFKIFLVVLFFTLFMGLFYLFILKDNLK